MKYMAKFLNHLFLQVWKYWYILCSGEQTTENAQKCQNLPSWVFLQKLL